MRRLLLLAALSTTALPLRAGPAATPSSSAVAAEDQRLYARCAKRPVDADAWTGPRSHVMVNHGVALTAMTPAACSAAVATAVDVCADLQATMPFVAWCSAAGQSHVETDGPVCSIRFTVGFGQLAPDTGVFTTSLPGILAFTIR